MTEVSLRGRTALVTGAKKRLGRATALALASEGVNIVVHHRDPGEDVGDVVEEIRRRGAQAWTAAADLEKPAEYETLIERAIAAAGSLDILINNASIFPPGTLEEVSFDDLVRNARINAWVPFALSRDFARRVGRGKIVNLLDSRITGYDRQHTAYLLSKHLLAQLTRLTAREFAPAITVNAVAPGLILPPEGKDESYLESLVERVPLKRHGTAQDITDAILYLLKSDFLTGQIIYVDGGRHLREGADGSYLD